MDVDYWAFEHGDDLETSVTPAEQREGTRGDDGNCAVVRNLLHSSPAVVKAKVKAGDIYVYARNEKDETWVFRFVMDRLMRELAKGFDKGIITPEPVRVTMRFDKRWQLKESDKPRKDKELIEAKPRRKRSTLSSQVQTFQGKGTHPAKGITVDRPRKKKTRRVPSSRWDPMFYTNHQSNRA